MTVPGGPKVHFHPFPVPPAAGCIQTDFLAKFNVRDNKPMRSVKVYVNGKLVKTTRKKNFSARISAGRVHVGRNTIRVVAVSSDGKRAVKTRAFHWCQRATVSPDFTG